MHPNPVFHTSTDDKNLAFARDRGFGVLTVNGPDRPMLAHIPFLLRDEGQVIDLHLVRSNPIARALGAPLQAVLAVSGPDSYVSPDWYGIDDQVPTWNYVAVHLSGVIEKRPADELRDVLDRESELFERRLLPKLPWAAAKMDGAALDKMMRMIVPCRMQITSIDGTWKLNQNKADDVRLRAADHVESDGVGTGLARLAAMMRDP
ncbi:FMN-binding negative transcriptional regulator [Phaeobacter marinintestinus]|uniref:FMN-binding negative transcriptional regulator n=1 Tax=Falsiphaeobacter marinintestinus TaxID=1492905 RepID=UPI0011B72C7B|nr:FMN-binding negative transcriptional regulator [Phaeobacter marinintestinus]